jgi:hypothetical protein
VWRKTLNDVSKCSNILLRENVKETTIQNKKYNSKYLSLQKKAMIPEILENINTYF